MPQCASSFNLQTLLESAGWPTTVQTYAPTELLFAPGDPADHVLYRQRGRVTLSVRGNTGSEVVIETLRPRGVLRRGMPARRLSK
jgi:CRP-like cAMP-binding protein